MNIGIDIDGTLTAYPEFFITMGKLFIDSGHSVYIITGLGQEKAEERLTKIVDTYTGTNFFTKLLTTSLYNQDERDLIGKIKNNEIIVGTFKQRICREYNIDIMFDDQAAIHLQCGIKNSIVPIFTVPKIKNNKG